MAYCKNCGAYIPDGHTKCLACGLEQNENKKNEYGSGSSAQADPREAARQSTEDLRRRLDEQRKKQQEDSRKWAEAERERRQRQQEQQKEEQAWRESSTRPERYRANKTLAALSYLSVLFILPFLFARDDSFAMYHAKQGALLFAISAAGEVLGSIFGLGWIVTLFRLYWIYKGMTNASAGKMEPLPYIGNLISK